MSIYCIGQAVYDITFPMKGSLVENQKYRIENKQECIGAPATNAASLCGLWSAETVLIARVGNDFYGKEICSKLKQNKVNIDYIYVDEHFQTPLSVVITNTNNGNRTLFNYPGHLNDIDFTLPKHSPSVILVDGHELDVSLRAIKQFPNAISIIDAGSFRAATERLSRQIDYLVCSQDFAYQYTNVDIDIRDEQTWACAFAKLRKLSRGHITITLGEKGLLYEDKGEIKHLPAYPTKAVDTTGAGDIFHGAFAYCIDKKYKILDALKIASMAASISVRSMGAQTSIPSKEQVNQELINVEKGLYLK